MRSLMLLASGMCVGWAQAATRSVHITGTAENTQSWEITGYCTAMVVRSTELPQHGVVSTRPQLMVDLKTGSFEGEIECEVIRNAHGRWVDLHFVGFSYLFTAYPEMVVRVPYATRIDLGSFAWKPSHYRWKNGALVIDTAVPRDTVIGDRFGTHVRISPINPAPDDTVHFAFTWENSGQPHQASMGGLYMKDCCTHLCDFTFAVRTDTDVYGESWPHHVTLYLPPKLAEGRYRIRQVPAPGANLRDVDFLLGKELYFTVGERGAVASCQKLVTNAAKCPCRRRRSWGRGPIYG
ncbi:MAG: hypothetical protein IPP26_06300 [Flavobacteriales bacterium]|nr:hypothetical protein [Flavobacteriales bacterium]